MVRRLLEKWNALSLAGQYCIAASAVLCCAMVAIGTWVTSEIEDGITTNAASSTALYVDSVIAPLLPEFSDNGPLDEGVTRALDEVLSQGALGKRLISFKIWHPDGTVLYALDPSLIGQKFPPTEAFRTALGGDVAVELDDLAPQESKGERAKGVPLIEIYNPIRAPWTGEVVAVSEFYEVATDIEAQLRAARWKSWLVVAGVILATMALLAGIVFRGSKVIQLQRRTLEARVAELSKLLAQNRLLRDRVQKASQRTTSLNERYLRRIGADLHDGPAQHVAFAALRIDSDALTSPSTTPRRRQKEIGAIRASLEEAMSEIRNICNGLVLPHIEAAELPRIIDLAITAHEQRTGSTVERPADIPSFHLSTPQKICVFRFLQEALNNAHRHAGGKGQAIDVSTQYGAIALSVSDQGNGFDPARRRPEGLGLAGLKERAESIGGQFSLETSGRGTRVTLTLPGEPAEAA